MDPQDLKRRFAYHPPADDTTRRAHEEIRMWCGNLAIDLNLAVPEGREKALAMTHLEEVMFWANAAIARNGGPAGR